MRYRPFLSETAKLSKIGIKQQGAQRTFEKDCRMYRNKHIYYGIFIVGKLRYLINTFFFG